MSSPVSICNIALSWLGEKPIISFDDPTNTAQLCKVNYEPLRDAVLEERVWTFAVARIKPARLSDDPPYGFDAYFQIPPDVIKVLQVSKAAAVDNSGVYASPRFDTGQGKESPIPWNREGDRIATSQATAIYARVLKRIEDTNKFSAMFVQALAARIAMDLCIPITENRTLQEQMTTLYAAKLAMAASSDGSQGRSERTRSNSLTAVR